MSYRPDPRSRFCKVRLQPSGKVVELLVQKLKKPVQCGSYKVHECVEHNGNLYALPEHWAHLAHVYEIPDSEAIAQQGGASC